MTLAVAQVTNNPSIPLSIAETYIPDQLIAGAEKLITQNIVLAGGQGVVARGTVLGVSSTSTAPTSVAASGNTGNGTISAISTGTKTKLGTYAVQFLTATTYNVINPFGHDLVDGLTAGSYGANPHDPDPEIKFTFTAGGTAMVAGDIINIVVGAGAGSYKKSVATATDGSENPTAILVDTVDTTAGAQNAGVYVKGEFNTRSLIYDASFTAATIATALAANNPTIWLKTPVDASDPT